MFIKIFYPCDPVAKGRPRITRSGHAYTPERTRNAETGLREFLRGYCRTHKLAPITDQQIAVCLLFILKKPKKPKYIRPLGRPDTDNLAKLVLDCGNEILWDDDSRILWTMTRKEYQNEERPEPGIDILISSQNPEALKPFELANWLSLFVTKS